MGAIKGKRIIYLYRLLSEASTNNAKGVAFTTENTRSKSRDADSVSTKDGNVRVPGDLETTISTTALFSTEGDEMIKKIEKAIDEGLKMEIWEVNLDQTGTGSDAGKYAAKYFRGYPTSFELTSNSSDHAEASLEFAIEGKGASGYATVTEDQKELAEYVFADTQKSTGA